MSVTEKTSTGVQAKRTEFVYDAFDRRVVDRLDLPGGNTIDRVDWSIPDGDDTLLMLCDSDGSGSAEKYA